jgi:hypothetical protein
VTTLADDVARVLASEPLGLPCCDVARRVRRRRGDVLSVLLGDRRFVHDGRGRGSRWRLAAGVPRRGSQAHLGSEDMERLGLDPSGVPIVATGAQGAS